MEWHRIRFLEELIGEGLSFSNLIRVIREAEEMAKKLGYSKTQFVRLALQDLLEREGIHYLVEVKAA